MRRALEVSGLRVDLGGRTILEDVSLRVDEGKLVVLIGPNGAGKTTLMRAIMGLVPYRGSIEASGSVIGYVPQRQDLDWNYPISAAQLVATAFTGQRRAPRGATRLEAVYRALDAVGMYAFRNRTINETSGGQKQRILVARALVASPRLLLLDEPFTGLDHPNQDTLSRLVVDLARSGVGILMSTHDLGQAVDICHRLVMLNGTVSAEGERSTLCSPEPWMETFHGSKNSALLRSLGACAAIGIALALFHDRIVLVSVDRDFAISAGLRVGRIDLLLHLAIATAVVVSIQTIGNVLVLSLLIAPAATARLLTDRVVPMMLIGPVIGAVSAFLCIWASWSLNIPSGAAIVLVATLLFALAQLLSPGRGLLLRARPVAQTTERTLA